MKTIQIDRKLPAESELLRVIEPLASYICAADRPKERLLSVLSVLRSEVQAMNQVAMMHVTSRCSEALGLVA
jgi:hypothetical protein